MSGKEFRIEWPILPVKNEKDRTAARRQAATFIYHDVKAACMKLKVWPPEVVFMAGLLDEQGRTYAQRQSEGLPLLPAPKGH